MLSGYFWVMTEFLVCCECLSMYWVFFGEFSWVFLGVVGYFEYIMRCFSMFWEFFLVILRCCECVLIFPMVF